MNNDPLCNIRMFHAGRFTVCVDALEDCDFDTAHMDPETAADMRDGIESGRYIRFTARAYIMFDGLLLAEEFLGGCVYADYSDFMDHFGIRAKSRKASEEAGRPVCYGSSFADMVHAVIEEARATLRKLAAVRVRG